jgi:hypothetical protein
MCRAQELMERDEDRDSLDALPGMTLASLQEEADELKKELQQAKDNADHWKVCIYYIYYMCTSILLYTCASICGPSSFMCI